MNRSPHLTITEAARRLDATRTYTRGKLDAGVLERVWDTEAFDFRITVESIERYEAERDQAEQEDPDDDIEPTRVTARRKTAIICADCRTFHGEKRPATPLCSCAVIDPRQGSCSCEATVIRAAAGIKGWGVIPAEDDAVVELSQARCDACRRTLPPGPRYRTTIFHLDPTPEPITPGDAWRRAASPGSQAALVGQVTR